MSKLWVAVDMNLWLTLRNITRSNEGRNFQSTTSHTLPWEMSFIQSIADLLLLYFAGVLVFLSTIFWCHVSYWWGYDENGKVEDEEESKKNSQRKNESWAWKMKIFPINTKLNEHDFWDIDGFQFFFCFSFVWKEWRKVLFRYFSASRPESWELREKKVFLSSPYKAEWMNEWLMGMALRGHKSCFQSLVIVDEKWLVCIPNPSLSINSQ